MKTFLSKLSQNGTKTATSLGTEIQKKLSPKQKEKTLAFDNGRRIVYSFDDQGRVVKIVDSLEGYTEYTYNEQGLISMENINSVRTGFAYDEHGRMRYKGICNENGIVAEENKILYIYQVEGDYKKLMNYNDTRIVYNKNNLPYAYCGRRIGWDKQNNMTFCYDVDYTYSESGFRLTKTQDDIVHEYKWRNDMLVGEVITEGCCEPQYTLQYLYGIDGGVCGLVCNDVPYSFYKNLFGDVIAMVDQSGKTVATYFYNSLGEILSIKDDKGRNIDENNYTHIANINPFRYRGVYYDREDQLYYLPSGYYDPIAGVLIGADALMIPKLIFLPYELRSNFWSFVQSKIPSKLLPLFQKLKSKYGNHITFSSYKGVPVVTLSFMGSNAFSFGVIFAGPDAARNANTLDHERGHVIQLFTMGPIKYTLFVALPSVATYWYDRVTGKVSNKLYYSLPWEHTADIFGGAKRDQYHIWAQTAGWAYYVIILQLAALLAFMFL